MKPFKSTNLNLLFVMSLVFTVLSVAQEPQSETLEVDKAALQDELLIAIENVEALSGPFDVGLAEPLEDLADILSEQGEHSEALQHYGRLLHINRINDGLYGDGQFLIIDKIIQGNLALGDWKALNDSQEYYYFLTQRVHGEDIVKRLESLNRHIDWKLSYFGLDPRREKSKVLLDLQDFTEEAIELREGMSDGDKTQLAASYYQRAMIHYYMFSAIDGSKETGRELARRKSGSTRAFLDAGYVPTNVDTDPQIRLEKNKGRRLFEKTAELFSSSEEKQQLAMAKVYFGDWNLLTDRREKALQAYRSANQIFLDSGLSQDEINHRFARPTIIPITKPSFSIEETNTSEGIEKIKNGESILLENYYAWSESIPGVSFPFSDILDAQSMNQENFVDVSLTVKVATKKIATPSPNAMNSHYLREGKGNVASVKIIEANTSSDKSRWEARDDLDQLMFRPQIVDGEAIETKATMRYIFAPDQ